MQRLPFSLLVLSAVVGCAGAQPFGMPSPVASGGFIGPDLLLGATYATADGLFVGPVGGEARRLAPWSGSTRELRWALDDTALLVVESEREAACVATEIGTTCSSSNMDDFARLVKVTVSDGARTVLADQVARVGAQAIIAGQPVTLGALDGSSAQGPFWNAESTAVRFVRTDNGRELPVQELPLDGEARRFAVARTVQPGNIQELSNAPDGSHLVAGGFDRAAGVHPLMRLDLDGQTLTPLAPDGTLLHWLGSAPDFLCTVGRSWGKRFYVVRPDGP